MTLPLRVAHLTTVDLTLRFLLLDQPRRLKEKGYEVAGISAPGLEFGVYVGTSLLCMHRAIKAVGLRSLCLFGFDSFQGLPERAARDDEGPWQPRQYRAEYGVVRKRLTRSGIDWSRTVLVPGWFEVTLRPALAY